VTPTLRFAVDTGGTFTDLVVQEADGSLSAFKAPTTDDDLVQGLLDVFAVAARARGERPDELLGRGRLLVHATTRPLNALLTRGTARTALLTTEGHEDILLMREGGRSEAFDFTRDYPDPYVPRSLTFGIRERIASDGEIVLALDELSALDAVRQAEFKGVEAIAVCFLWSIVNPAHELAVGQLVRRLLPDVPLTLSHELNPAIREFRRASAATIDASLKPLMGGYFDGLSGRLRTAGFGGEIMIAGSNGDLLTIDQVAQAPIHAVKSGPAMAPVAARAYAGAAGSHSTLIIADAGGTTFDVSVVQCGRIPHTRETWLGNRDSGVMTGFPSVDVRSIAAGGGSIAFIDDSGLLRVGPASAGNDPGPICYGRGGTNVTVTDAALVLGYLDPEHFLGGALRLDAQAAARGVETQIAEPLGVGASEAAVAIFAVATENMAAGIEAVTVQQGLDPRDALLVAGGGAAGLTVVAVARALGCGRVLVPEGGPELSAVGALLARHAVTSRATLFTTTESFASEEVNVLLEQLARRAASFLDEVATFTFFAEARYSRQVWELEVVLPFQRFAGPADVEVFRREFDRLHQAVFAVADESAAVEIVSWGVTAAARHETSLPPTVPVASTSSGADPRAGVQVVPFATLAHRQTVTGPAIIELDWSTVVLDASSVATRRQHGLEIVVGTVETL
jgi:N-methylhydantoinase A